MVNVTVTLDKTSGRLSHREPFLLGENEDLMLQLKSNFTLDNVLVNFKNGDTIKQYRLESNPFIVPKEVVKHGVLDCEVNLVAGGRVVKTYIVEPIVLYSVGATFVGHPEFDLLKLTLANQATEIKELRDKLNKVTDIEKRVAELEEKNEE